MKKTFFFILAIFCAFKLSAQGVAIDPSLTESPISVKTFAGSVSGSLVVPNNVSGKMPVVLIIGDAGAIDRDGNNAKTGLAANTYKILANDLGKNGIASLRYDKRLVGQSVSVTKESQLSMDDYGDDAASLINMLNGDQRFSKIIIFGHGEGSLVAMLALVDDLPVKGFITAEGAGEQADKMLTDQMTKTKSKIISDEFKVILDSLRKGKTSDNVDPALYNIARPSLQHFLMSWCRIVPARGIKRIKEPILIIQGSTDLQITVDNAEKLKKAKSDASLQIIKNMNHILRDAPADPDQNMAMFDKPNVPLKPEFVTAVVDFVNRVK